MTEREPALFARVKNEFGSMGADLKEMAALRWRLAQLELQAAVGLVKGLAIRLVVVGIAGIVSLPVLVVAAATALDQCLGVSYLGWLLIFGTGLLAGSIAGGYLAWRWFRRRFSGVEQSLEELHEDLLWLKQWSGDEGGGEEEDN